MGQQIQTNFISVLKGKIFVPVDLRIKPNRLKWKLAKPVKLSQVWVPRAHITQKTHVSKKYAYLNMVTPQLDRKKINICSVEMYKKLSQLLFKML